CQYCNCETAINRYYRNSLGKLETSIHQFNQNKKIKFVVGLGDLIDRDIASYDSVNAILAHSKHRVYNVAGNHDFGVEKNQLNQVPGKLHLKQTYYSFIKKDWMFIFLNGNEITVNSNNPEIVKQAEVMLAKLKQENKPNTYEWNGGMSREQINWMEEQLQKAKNINLKVVLFCHYPLLPLEAHTLWNSKEVLAVLEKYDNVKLWLNGHNHAGNYAFQDGIYFVNLKGMVETENENAYAEVSLSDKEITIKGFGREPNRTLPIQ
ncbi:MAG TPA: metallophosphoesterase, partial [Draconibacterium sp.]|nr:metallophosphoesterase [Draconibacterium sp.]